MKILKRIIFPILLIYSAVSTVIMIIMLLTENNKSSSKSSGPEQSSNLEICLASMIWPFPFVAAIGALISLFFKK